MANKRAWMTVEKATRRAQTCGLSVSSGRVCRLVVRILDTSQAELLTVPVVQIDITYDISMSDLQNAIYCTHWKGIRHPTATSPQRNDPSTLLLIAHLIHSYSGSGKASLLAKAPARYF